MPYNGPAIKRADPPAGGEGASLQRWPVTRSGSWYPASGGAGKVSRCKEGMAHFLHPHSCKKCDKQLTFIVRVRWS